MSESRIEQFRAWVAEMVTSGAFVNLNYLEGTLSSAPDWAVRKGEDGTWALDQAEVVTMTLAVNGSYHTVRLFAETEQAWALSLGAGSTVAVVVERVNAPKAEGKWSTYSRLLGMVTVSAEKRAEGKDRASAVARRKKRDENPKVRASAKLFA